MQGLYNVSLYLEDQINFSSKLQRFDIPQLDLHMHKNPSNKKENGYQALNQ